MFYYFGRKARLAPAYPAPEHSHVIEPFAGSMAYTLHHEPPTALGLDVDAAVAATWNRLAGLSPCALLSYPEPALGERTHDRWQMLAAGSHGTTRASSYLWTDRMSRDFAKQRRMAARHQPYVVGHVRYDCADYREAPDDEATWFIDPPYQHVRRGYARGNIDYGELAAWCLSRRGLVIVCEQQGADWLPFTPLRSIRGTTNKATVEVCYVRRSSASSGRPS